jgi:hypothetical protein
MVRLAQAVKSVGDMDPNETLRLINDCRSVHSRECVELIETLRGWIVRGGFHPDWTRYPKATRRYSKALGLGDDLRG